MTGDRGVQNERTSLSWARTALGLAGCALLACRLALVRGSGIAVGLALVGVLVAVAALGWSQDRYRLARRRIHTRQAVDFAVPALLLTAAVVLIGALSVILIMLPTAPG